MTTKMIIRYDAYVVVNVPTVLAKKLLSNAEKWYVRWGDLNYQSDDGEWHEIAGEAVEVDYKLVDERDISWEFDDDESDDEDNDDEDNDKKLCSACVHDDASSCSSTVG